VVALGRRPGVRHWIAYYDGHGKEQREPAGTKLDADGRPVPKSARDAQDLLHSERHGGHGGLPSPTAGREGHALEHTDKTRTASRATRV